MSQDFDADVAIIGYGPSGVIAALTLARQGASVVAFERDRDIYPRARAVTVNDWTMRIFQSLGIDERIEKVIDPQRMLRWVTYGGEEVMRIEHPPSTLGSRSRFYNIYQPTMEAELRSAGAEYGDLLSVRYGAEVTGIDQEETGVTVTTTDPETGQSRTCRVRYAIGADGGSSRTRGWIGANLDGDTAETLWIVVDCAVRRWWPDRDVLTFWTDRKRPVVDIALSGGNHRWELPLMHGEAEADFPTAAEVWPLLEAIGVTADDVDIHRYAFYRHHVRMADTWRNGRIFLVGDAAHLMPPWAGAGMQTGMRDAHNLGWKLGRVLRGALPEAWLATYEAERRPNAASYTNLAVQLGRVIKQEATQAEIDAMNAVPEGLVTPHEPPLTAPPTLTAGWLRGEIADASIIGRMVPQPIVGDTAGRMTRLDDLLGDGFVLLGDDLDPAGLLTPEEKAGWDALGARYVAVRPRTVHTRGRDDLVDLDDVLGPWLRRYGSRAVALRPDRFVAADDVHGLAAPTCRKPARIRSIHHVRSERTRLRRLRGE
ncbi:bifunctional 3-(3-hydroxy-phenyl)propionate/3-hydroxycinnamic acid hydroxylase [Nocardia africana]|uniref:3-(3-hydroxy-phenyl)propionate/3-hydroxycinnamic acid hydroxylase n=1 Tax=Nocardia africana TaxID=134964 RepID=A0A378X024_9NOCA|nr:bifunctional 3-(3-hydroxy-phenyl)propionate/3-hydroxycinnamic acid hydroxylase [Nocardia africana]MCC3312477.1 bifunctional 3-(3-hydroxy-phenyl)propionate/3-hydroxycinnamic acid hydroxylase [Nocardia africana]SUA46205.1 3-(3-hydroxy-phenyl)propionate/3-hydroxycinnamic acid hydroxylase [Nocardia africana]